MFQRLGDTPAPGRTIFYLENCGRFAFWADLRGYDNHCGSPFPGAVVRGWQGQPWLFNVAFVDGHASPINMRGFNNPRLGRYPAYAGTGGDHAFWKCVIVRGDDWQLDTLPLQPAATPMACSSVGQDIESPGSVAGIGGGLPAPLFRGGCRNRPLW